MRRPRGFASGSCSPSSAYTTFSTFAQHLYDLGEARQLAAAVVNLSASVGIGVLAVAAGTSLDRLL
jgi:fluoride ion exporter CrcB/FEX